jgi:hypothetical protein
MLSLWRDSETWGDRALARSRKIPHSGDNNAKTKLKTPWAVSEKHGMGTPIP